MNQTTFEPGVAVPLPTERVAVDVSLLVPSVTVYLKVSVPVKPAAGL